MDTMYPVGIIRLGIFYTNNKSLVGFWVYPLAGWPVRPYQITHAFQVFAKQAGLPANGLTGNRTVGT
jgi:hypothetical protein